MVGLRRHPLNYSIFSQIGISSSFAGRNLLLVISTGRSSRFSPNYSIVKYGRIFTIVLRIMSRVKPNEFAGFSLFYPRGRFIIIQEIGNDVILADMANLHGVGFVANFPFHTQF